MRWFTSLAAVRCAVWLSVAVAAWEIYIGVTSGPLWLELALAAVTFYNAAFLTRLADRQRRARDFYRAMNGNSTMQVHLPRIPAHAAPGTLFVRICTHLQPVKLLDAHPVDLPRVTPSGMTEDDARLVFEYIDEHPGDAVRVYVYDGDSGACVATILVQGGDR